MQELESLKELARLIETWEDVRKLQDSVYCAYQAKSLLPALEAAFSALKQEGMCEAADHLYHPKDNSCGCTFCDYRRKLEAELAALKEQAEKAGEEHFQAIRDLQDAAAEHERLAVSAALREAAKSFDGPYAYGGLWYADKVQGKILAHISDSDRSALDAHDADVWDRALEEAAQHCESRLGLPRTGAYDALVAVAREIRNLRGSK